MKTVNDLIKVPELNQTMQQMSREMMKAGLIEETMGEMMDDVFDTDDIEEDADAEVDKVPLIYVSTRPPLPPPPPNTGPLSGAETPLVYPGPPITHAYWHRLFFSFL